MWRLLPYLALLAGSRCGTCLTPPTTSSAGSLLMAEAGADDLLPATALAVALVALDEVQRNDVSEDEEDPVDDLPREKLTRSQRKRRDVKKCAWAQLLEDKDLEDSTSITAKQFRVDFRTPYPFFLRLVEVVKSKDWFPTAMYSSGRGKTFSSFMAFMVCFVRCGCAQSTRGCVCACAPTDCARERSAKRRDNIFQNSICTRTSHASETHIETSLYIFDSVRSGSSFSYIIFPGCHFLEKMTKKNDTIRSGLRNNIGLAPFPRYCTTS